MASRAAFLIEVGVAHGAELRPHVHADGPAGFRLPLGLDVLAGEVVEPGEGDALALVRPFDAGLAQVVEDHRQEVARIVSPTRQRGRHLSWPLALEHVAIHGSQGRFVIDVLVPAAPGPPVAAQDRGCMLFQPARAPSLELLARQLDLPSGRGDHDVNVIGPAIDRMEGPLADRTMVGNGFLNKAALFRIEAEGRFQHVEHGLELSHGIGFLKAAATLIPAARVAGPPIAVYGMRKPMP
jgi:hypothetical protein